MKEFKESAEAVVKAMGVLKSYYEGAFLQTGSKTAARRPEFGGAKSDFTRLFAETETAEDEAAAAYEKLSKENEVSKATKLADAKAKESEIKSLTVQVGHSKEDAASTSSELDAVNAYLEKLKPQCEEKAMSYEERKAAREAEIE